MWTKRILKNTEQQVEGPATAPKTEAERGRKEYSLGISGFQREIILNSGADSVRDAVLNVMISFSNIIFLPEKNTVGNKNFFEKLTF